MSESLDPGSNNTPKRNSDRSQDNSSSPYISSMPLALDEASLQALSVTDLTQRLEDCILRDINKKHKPHIDQFIDSIKQICYNNSSEFETFQKNIEQALITLINSITPVKPTKKTKILCQLYKEYCIASHGHLYLDKVAREKIACVLLDCSRKLVIPKNASRSTFIASRLLIESVCDFLELTHKDRRSISKGLDLVASCIIKDSFTWHSENLVMSLKKTWDIEHASSVAKLLGLLKLNCYNEILLECLCLLLDIEEELKNGNINSSQHGCFENLRLVFLKSYSECQTGTENDVAFWKAILEEYDNPIWSLAFIGLASIDMEAVKPYVTSMLNYVLEEFDYKIDTLIDFLDLHNASDAIAEAIPQLSAYQITLLEEYLLSVEDFFSLTNYFDPETSVIDTNCFSLRQEKAVIDLLAILRL